MKALTAITMLGVLVVGCASHGTWSKSDRGAWATLDTFIGSNEKNYYIGHWGEPVSRRNINVNDGSGNVTPDGEEILWLWKPDGTGPSDQPGLGWELFLAFNEQGRFRNWRVGTYQTPLTLTDLAAACRKSQYRVDVNLLKELGLSQDQHGIGERRSEFSLPSRREMELLKLQNAVRVLSALTFEADTAARNLHDRLATETEIQSLLEVRTAETRARANTQRRAASRHSSIPQDAAENAGGVSGGFLGRGFLGPYTPNAYGPGMNMDATGRPFIWQPQWGGTGFPDPTLQVRPDAYGPGVGMDQYGRPVRPACPPGWAGPC